MFVCLFDRAAPSGEKQPWLLFCFSRWEATIDPCRNPHLLLIVRIMILMAFLPVLDI